MFSPKTCVVSTNNLRWQGATWIPAGTIGLVIGSDPIASSALDILWYYSWKPGKETVLFSAFENEIKLLVPKGPEGED